MNTAVLLLEDGTVYKGVSFGARGTRCAEVIFNTSMTGYQEILTDPSYCGQMVAMTYPLIGNYGVNPDDVQSAGVHAAAFIVSENSRIYSSHRGRSSLGDYLRRNDVIGLCGIDTRALTRHLRKRGAMNGIIASGRADQRALRAQLARWPGLAGRDLTEEVTTRRAYVHAPAGRQTVVVIDCGVKRAILNELANRGCRVVVVPAGTTAAAIRAYMPDGILVSNGPGDPAPVTRVSTVIRELMGAYPLFGICLGLQLIGLALGGKTYKLRFGHHGANHPVRETASGRVMITAQNHNYCVDPASLPVKDAVVTHINLYDNTCAGMRHRRLPIYAVQFHPEACPGPREARRVFDEFIAMMKEPSCPKIRA